MSPFSTPARRAARWVVGTPVALRAPSVPTTPQKLHETRYTMISRISSQAQGTAASMPAKGDNQPRISIPPSFAEHGIGLLCMQLDIDATDRSHSSSHEAECDVGGGGRLSPEMQSVSRQASFETSPQLGKSLKSANMAATSSFSHDFAYPTTQGLRGGCPEDVPAANFHRDLVENSRPAPTPQALQSQPALLSVTPRRCWATRLR